MKLFSYKSFPKHKKYGKHWEVYANDTGLFWGRILINRNYISAGFQYHPNHFTHTVKELREIASFCQRLNK